MATLHLNIAPLPSRTLLTEVSGQQSGGIGAQWFELIKHEIDLNSLQGMGERCGCMGMTGLTLHRNQGVSTCCSRMSRSLRGNVDICYQIIEVYEVQQKVSSSRSCKWADVNVEAVKREVRGLGGSACADQGGDGSDRGHNDGINDTIIADMDREGLQYQQQHYRVSDRSDSDDNSDKKKPYKNRSLGLGEEPEEEKAGELGLLEDEGNGEDQWEAPPSRPPVVHVSVIGRGGAGTSSRYAGQPPVATSSSSAPGSVPPTPDSLPPPPPTPDFLPPPTPEYTSPGCGLLAGAPTQDR